MNRLTASRLELAATCPAAFKLPWRDDRTDDADTGKTNHAEYERRILAGDVPEALTVTFPNVTAWFAETKLAWNIATRVGRIIGTGTDRDYSDLGPAEMAGTCDVYGIDGDRVIVVDWKLAKFIKAEHNLQLRWYAMTLASALGKESATVAIFPEFGTPSISDLDFFHFDAFATRLHAITLAVNAPPPEYNVGPQCRHCPGFLACPTTSRELALVKSGATATGIEAIVPLETDEQAAYAYEMLGKVETLAKRLRAAVHARGAERPFPVGPGRMFGSRPVKGNRQIDGDKAYEMIRQKYGQAVADQAVTREATQKGIEDAFKAAGVPSAGAEKDRLVKALEKLGAVTRKDSTKIEEYEVQPQPQLKAVQ